MSAYRLTFTLPPAFLLLAEPGRHSPCLHGCLLVVERDGRVRIEGPNREQVLNQATRFLRVVGKETIAGRAPPQSISARLVTPPRLMRPFAGSEERALGLGGTDGWSIIVGADVAFSPTGLDPVLAAPEAGSEHAA